MKLIFLLFFQHQNIINQLKLKLKLRTIHFLTHQLCVFIKIVHKSSCSELSILKIRYQNSKRFKTFKYFVNLLFKENFIIKAQNYFTNLFTRHFYQLFFTCIYNLISNSPNNLLSNNFKRINLLKFDRNNNFLKIRIFKREKRLFQQSRLPSSRSSRQTHHVETIDVLRIDILMTLHKLDQMLQFFLILKHGELPLSFCFSNFFIQTDLFFKLVFDDPVEEFSIRVVDSQILVVDVFEFV